MAPKEELDKIFKALKLTNFNNYDEQPSEELDDEKLEENRELTE